MRWFIIETWRDNFTFRRLSIEEIKSQEGMVESHDSWKDCHDMVHYRAKIKAVNVNYVLVKFMEQYEDEL